MLQLPDAPMFEKYTEGARGVVVGAMEAARTLGHLVIEPEHLLVGLRADPHTVSGRVLADLGVPDSDELIAGIAARAGRGDQPALGQIPFSAPAKKVLELGLREALSLGHNYIGTEHLAIALTRQWEGHAVDILASLALKPEAIREALIRDLTGGPKEPSAIEWTPGLRDVTERFLAACAETSALLDRETIPVEELKKFLRRATDAASNFEMALRDVDLRLPAFRSPDAQEGP